MNDRVRRGVSTLCLVVGLIVVWAEFASAQDGEMIRSGDRVDVRVERQPRYSGTYKVNMQGAIDFPLVGQVQAADLLPHQLRLRLEQKLARFLRSPEVQVSVQGRQQQYTMAHSPQGDKTIYVLGELTSQGPVYVEEPIRLLPFMSLIKGLPTNKTSFGRNVQDEFASPQGALNPDLENVLLVRPNGQTRRLNVKSMLTGDLTDNVLLDDGDTLVFNPLPQRNTFSVFGSIRAPGMYQIGGPITLVEALTIAGGLAADADYRQIRIFHGRQEAPETMRINLQEMIRVGEMDHMPMVSPGDTIWVPRNWLSKMGDMVDIIRRTREGNQEINLLKRTTDITDEEF